MATRGGIHIDDSELADLELDMKKAPARIRNPEGLRRGAKFIEREMRVDAAGHKGNFFGKPGTSYVIPTPTVSSEMVAPLTIEVGIEAKRSGSLFHLLAYGSVKNVPAYDPGAGPRRAMPRVLNVLGEHAEDSVLGRGGGR
jgi:hypothetical protein